MAVDIDTGSQKRIDVIAYQFFSDTGRQFLCKRLVPCARDQCPDRDLGGICAIVHADSGWSVRTAADGYAEAEQVIRDPAKCSGSSRRHFQTAHALPAHDRCQILHGKLGDKRFHSAFSGENIF